ncbi:MAG: hypothetical protein IPN67_13030 [Bacteroidales bacterium]|nr:hypothetical protein [Bacteroidales bacterium]
MFYSFSPDFWHEVYLAIKSELGLIYNNIHYLEVSIDVNKNLVEAFGCLYSNCINNNLRSGARYRMRNGTIVNVMSNGSSFLIGGVKIPLRYTTNQLILNNSFSTISKIMAFPVRKSTVLKLDLVGIISDIYATEDT